MGRISAMQDLYVKERIHKYNLIMSRDLMHTFLINIKKMEEINAMRDLNAIEDALNTIIQYNIPSHDTSFKKKMDTIITKAEPNEIKEETNTLGIIYTSDINTNIFHLLSTINKIIENMKEGNNYNLSVNVTLHDCVISDKKIKKGRMINTEPTNQTFSFEKSIFADSYFSIATTDFNFILAETFGSLCQLYEKYQPEYFSTLNIKITKI